MKEWKKGTTLNVTLPNDQDRKLTIEAFSYGSNNEPDYVVIWDNGDETFVAPADLESMVDAWKVKHVFKSLEKPHCPKCKGEESPHSLEPVDENYWKCHECGLIFKPTKPGRPSLGVTKKVSLTLSDEAWSFIQRVQHDQDMNQSEALRYIIEKSMVASDPETWGDTQPVVKRG